jgi:hypothetical protein
VHAAETSIAMLKKEHLPRLLDTARSITNDFVRLSTLPSTKLMR